MRLYLCGQKHFGAAVLEAVRKAGHEVLGVSSPRWAQEKVPHTDDYPGGREDRLYALARRLGVPWHPPGWLSASTVPAGCDLVACAHSHDFIGRATRAATRLGGIGYHPSLLPLHRGRDAVRWAVKMRDAVTGGSVYWLTDVVDGGPIAAQDWCFVRPDDTAESLWRRELSPMGVRLLLKTLADLDGGLIVRVPQDDALATWEPAFDPPMLHRPELPQLGSPPGFRVQAVKGCAPNSADNSADNSTVRRGAVPGSAAISADKSVDADERAAGLAAVRAALYGVEIMESSP